jgi:hypothetical protein
MPALQGVVKYMLGGHDIRDVRGNANNDTSSDGLKDFMPTIRYDAPNGDRRITVMVSPY